MHRNINKFGGRLGLITLCALWIKVGISEARGADAAQFAGANNTFAFALVKQLVKEKPGENIFISPYSISSALQMVRAGAAGETLREMDQVLGVKGWDRNAAATAAKSLSDSIQRGSTNATLSIANAIWYNPGIQLKPEFVSLNKEFYDAALSVLDFTDPRASGVVNRWVDQQTHGKIKTLVEGPMSQITSAFLANAIYFKGRWLTQFEKEATTDRLFNLAYGQQKTVPMMSQARKFLYAETDDFQAVNLAYKGAELGMYVVLPKAGSSSQKLLERMNATWWNLAIARFSVRDGTLQLPRFRMEYGTELKPSLAALGMNQAFTRNANFSAMASDLMRVESVIHKSFVEINEEGTEAAAATGVMMVPTVGPPPEILPFEMNVNHPFLFVIEESQSHAILFFGMVLDPETN